MPKTRSAIIAFSHNRPNLIHAARFTIAASHEITLFTLGAIFHRITLLLVLSPIVTNVSTHDAKYKNIMLHDNFHPLHLLTVTTSRSRSRERAGRALPNAQYARTFTHLPLSRSARVSSILTYSSNVFSAPYEWCCFHIDIRGDEKKRMKEKLRSVTGERTDCRVLPLEGRDSYLSESAGTRLLRTPCA